LSSLRSRREDKWWIRGVVERKNNEFLIALFVLSITLRGIIEGGVKGVIERTKGGSNRGD